MPVAPPEAITLLAQGPTAPAADVLQKWVATAVQEVANCQEATAGHERTLLLTGAARERVVDAAKTLLAALQGARDLGIDDFSMEPPPGGEQLELALEALTASAWAEQTDWYQRHRPGRGKKKSGSRRDLPQAVLRAHQLARSLLTACGVHCAIGPTSSGGAALTKLGALLCLAAGIKLPAGESTAAAELAGSKDLKKLLPRESGRVWPEEPLLP